MSCPAHDAERLRQALGDFGREVAKAVGPTVAAFNALAAEMVRMCEGRLAARGLTWDQVSHLPPDQLAAVVWGGAEAPGVPDVPVVPVVVNAPRQE